MVRSLSNNRYNGCMAPEIFHPAVDELELTAVMHALSDPARLKVVQTLAVETERACGTFELGVTKATASHHFKVLREAGIVRKRAEGARAYLTLRRDDLDARFPGLLDAVLAAEPARATASGS
jgi:DNA-binding transcriptional ArsR family regulator